MPGCLPATEARWYTAASMARQLAKPPARVVVEPVDGSFEVEAVVVSFARLPQPAILESSLPGVSYGRYSIFAASPADVFEFGVDDAGCPLAAFAQRCGAYPRIAQVPAEVPFPGGWVGFLAYEAGLGIEGIARATSWDVDLPLVRFCLYDTAVVCDHQLDRWYVLAVDWPEPWARRRPTVAARLAAARAQLAASRRLALPNLARSGGAGPLEGSLSRAEYDAAVERALEHIRAGDIYQVNLTQRFTTRTHESPLEVYRRLRCANPATYAALLMWDEGRRAVLSSSPELFLELRDGKVLTRPIKGTVPRGATPAEDSRQRQVLAESEKDAAELNMIVDLLRNDLGRVCAYGSVKVLEAALIEEWATVYHRVATIEGVLRPEEDAHSLLRAVFPGGSITGAPKIRAMQIINELEPTARGVYCGGIGWLGLDGSLRLNIAIRTMVQVDDRVHLYAGGGIVADSNAEAEYQESLAKARGMLRALGLEDEVPALRTRKDPSAGGGTRVSRRTTEK